MQTSTYRVIIVYSILCSCLFYSCAAVIIGAGVAGAGAFAYTKGTLKRVYEYGYHETIDACIDTLESLKIPVDDKIADELKTTVSAKRPDGTPVNVEVLRVNPKYTEVGIRTGKLGVFDKKTSYQIHDHILSRLKLETNISSGLQDLPASKSSIKESDINEAASETGTSPEYNIYQKLELTVYFDVNTNSLSETETEKLNRFVEKLNNGSNVKLIIIGYSDATGTPIYNKMLSLHRAETVQMYLIGKGVSRNQTETYGHGSQNFVSTNATEEGRRLNRRVEMYLEQKN